MTLKPILLTISLAVFNFSCAHQQMVVDQGGDAPKSIKLVDNTTIQNENRSFTCLVGQDQRVVTLKHRDERCEVNYTKYGDQQQMAWAENTPKLCDQAYENIRKNIEKAGYKCMDGQAMKFEKPDKKTAPVKTAAVEKSH